MYAHKIGFTYDLKTDYLKKGYSSETAAEFDSEETIDAISNFILSKGFELSKIGCADELVKRLALGERWDIVFNIAEGLYGYSREALIPALLESYQIPFVFSDALSLGICHHKGYCKKVIQNAGVPTAKFEVIQSLKDVESIQLRYPLFAKPVAEGTGKGITELSVIHNPQELQNTVKILLESYKQEVLVEEFLPGREFTVGIVGNGDKTVCMGVMEIIFITHSLSYSYDTKADYKKQVKYKLIQGDLAKECESIALRVYKALNCKDASRVDIRLDSKDNPQFLEINPLAGLNPVDSDLPILCKLNGIEYSELLDKILTSALERYGL